jgi:hypothetical protein
MSLKASTLVGDRSDQTNNKDDVVIPIKGLYANERPVRLKQTTLRNAARGTGACGEFQRDERCGILAFTIRDDNDGPPDGPEVRGCLR